MSVEGLSLEEAREVISDHEAVNLMHAHEIPDDGRHPTVSMAELLLYIAACAKEDRGHQSRAGNNDRPWFAS